MQTEPLYENTTENCNISQKSRTLVFDSSVGALRYKTRDGEIVYLSSSSLANHDILSATHSDTQVTAISNGDILTVLDSKWSSLGIGSAGQYLKASSTSVTWANITYTDIVNMPTTLDGYGITDAQPLNASLTAIAGLSGTGVLEKTGTDTWQLVTAPTPAAHNIVGPAHTASGLIAGQFLKATGSTTFAFGAAVIRDLSDVTFPDIGFESDGDVLHWSTQYNPAGEWRTSGLLLGQLYDCSIDEFPSMGQVLRFNGSWANHTLTYSDVGAQPLSTYLTAIAALARTDGNIIVGNGSTWVAESGATARTSLGLGTTDTPQFLRLGLGGEPSVADYPLYVKSTTNSVVSYFVTELSTGAAQYYALGKSSGVYNPRIEVSAFSYEFNGGVLGTTFLGVPYADNCALIADNCNLMIGTRSSDTSVTIGTEGVAAITIDGSSQAVALHSIPAMVSASTLYLVSNSGVVSSRASNLVKSDIGLGSTDAVSFARLTLDTGVSTEPSIFVQHDGSSGYVPFYCQQSFGISYPALRLATHTTTAIHWMSVNAATYSAINHAYTTDVTNYSALLLRLVSSTSADSTFWSFYYGAPGASGTASQVAYISGEGNGYFAGSLQANGATLTAALGGTSAVFSSTLRASKVGIGRDVSGNPGLWLQSGVGGAGSINYVAAFYSTESIAAGVGAGLVLGGQYTSAGAYYEFGGIRGEKYNSTSGHGGGRLTLHATNGLTMTKYVDISADGVWFNVVGEMSTAATGFLATDSGVIKYRTVANVRSDIGAQQASTYLTDIAALARTDGNIIVGNGTTWVAESGATARTSLGLGTGDSPQFGRLGIGIAADGSVPLYVYSTPVVMVAPSDTSIYVMRQNNSYITFATPNGAYAGLIFGDTEDNDVGQVRYFHATNTLDLIVNAATALSLTDSAATLNGTVQATRLISTIAIGTSPLTVTSTTVVSNLNADLWDGYQFSDYLNQAVKTTSSPTFAGGTFSSAVNALDLVGYLIRRNTSDGSDNSHLILTGGGDASPTRGAQIYLSGNEDASGGGCLDLIAGGSGTIKLRVEDGEALGIAASRAITCASTITVNNIPALATAASLYLVSDGGILKSRTPTQVLSDIGGASAVHGLVSASHTVSGLTTGHFLKATGATSFGFAAHGLTYTDVGAQQSSTYLTAIAGLARTDGNIIVGNGTTWVAESGATARTSLGLGTGDSPQFTAISLGATLISGASISLGNTTSSSTATPLTINMGGTYANTAGDASKMMLRLYDDTSTRIGFSVSIGALESFCSTQHDWYLSTDLSMRLDSNSTTDMTRLYVFGKDGYAAALYLNAYTTGGSVSGDSWRIVSNVSATGTLTFQNNTSGSYVSKLTVNKTGDVTCGAGLISTFVNASGGNIYLGGTTADSWRLSKDDATTASFGFYNAGGVHQAVQSWTDSGTSQLFGALTGTSAVFSSTLQAAGITSTSSLTATSASDGAVLLSLNSERPWNFYQRSSGASTNLSMECESDGKSFIIKRNGGSNVFRTNVNLTAGSNYVYINEAGGPTTVYGTLDVSQAVTCLSSLSSKAFTANADLAAVTLKRATAGTGNLYIYYLTNTGTVKGYVGYASGATEAFYINNNLSGPMYFGTSNAIRVTIPTASAQISVGNTAPNALSSSYASVQVGGMGMLMGRNIEGAGYGLDINSNAYYDGTWKAIVTDECVDVALSNGQMKVYVSNGNVTADAGIPWTDVFTVSNTGDVFSTTLTNYGSSSTKTGWSAFTETSIWYKRIGKTLFVWFRIFGSSNSVNAKFTLPYTVSSSAPSYQYVAIKGSDNGANLASPAAMRITAGSATVECVKAWNSNPASADWTASGNKGVEGQFVVEVM